MNKQFGRLKHCGKRAFIMCCRKAGAQRDDEKLGEMFLVLKQIETRVPAGICQHQAASIASLNAESEIWVGEARKVLLGWDKGLMLILIKAMGPKLLIRILAYHGEDWSKITPSQMSSYSGQAPVITGSGTPPSEALKKMSARQRKRYEPRRYHRLACNSELKWVWSWFAFTSLEHHAWARTAYDRFRARGQGHYEALRNLAMKWIRVIHAMVRDQTAYDPKIHEARIYRNADSMLTKSA